MKFEFELSFFSRLILFIFYMGIVGCYLYIVHSTSDDSDFGMVGRFILPIIAIVAYGVLVLAYFILLRLVALIFH